MNRGYPYLALRTFSSCSFNSNSSFSRMYWEISSVRALSGVRQVKMRRRGKVTREGKEKRRKVEEGVGRDDGRRGQGERRREGRVKEVPTISRLDSSKKSQENERQFFSNT
jgi:hypothetical protein